MTAKERKAFLLAEQALKHLEFSYEDDEAEDLCPECGGCEPGAPEDIEEESTGHGPKCMLGQALVAVKEVLFADASARAKGGA